MKMCKNCECIYPNYYKNCPSCGNKKFKELNFKRNNINKFETFEEKLGYDKDYFKDLQGDYNG